MTLKKEGGRWGVCLEHAARIRSSHHTWDSKVGRSKTSHLQGTSEDDRAAGMHGPTCSSSTEHLRKQNDCVIRASCYGVEDCNSMCRCVLENYVALRWLSLCVGCNDWIRNQLGLFAQDNIPLYPILLQRMIRNVFVYLFLIVNLIVHLNEKYIVQSPKNLCIVPLGYNSITTLRVHSTTLRY